MADRLVEHFGDPIRVLAAGRAELQAVGLKPDLVDAILDPPISAAAADLAWAEGEGVHILTRDDPRYPPRLAQMAAPPILLFVRGDPEVLKDPILAIVGSRNPTPSGRDTTDDFAHYLAACGLTIVSGLAIGIDGAAHAGAMKGGRTVAVLGTGPDRIYPAAHRDLARRIARNGALVTEYPPGTSPIGRNFPRRNRIISGLSLGILVTEAALKSGSLITARYAVEQGREVFAIPGSIHNPLARGCHALIKDGAKLVESAADILEELAPLLGPLVTEEGVAKTPLPAGRGVGERGSKGERGSMGEDRHLLQHLPEVSEPDTSGMNDATGDLDADYLRLLENLGYDPVSPDELIRRTGLSAQDIASMLLMLELKGLVSPCPGGRYCRNA